MLKRHRHCPLSQVRGQSCHSCSQLECAREGAPASLPWPCSQPSPIPFHPPGQGSCACGSRPNTLLTKSPIRCEKVYFLALLLPVPHGVWSAACQDLPAWVRVSRRKEGVG